jgi:hypothetical protein
MGEGRLRPAFALLHEAGEARERRKKKRMNQLIAEIPDAVASALLSG